MTINYILVTYCFDQRYDKYSNGNNPLINVEDINITNPFKMDLHKIIFFKP